jgi:hypothetical protein
LKDVKCVFSQNDGARAQVDNTLYTAACQLWLQHASSPVSRVAIVLAGVAGTAIAGPRGEAPFYALQLLEAVVELRPRWLPPRMFELLMERWRHPDRAARCAPCSPLTEVRNLL